MPATLIIGASILLHVGCLAAADRLTRMFIFVLLLSHVYFCAGGYFYWVWFRDREFTGWVWQAAALDRALIVMSLATAGVAFVVTVVNGFRWRTPRPLWHGTDLNIRVKALIYVVVVSIVCGMYVLAIGDSTGSGFVLIAYTLSDMLIPSILFALILGRRYRNLGFILVGVFVLYAILVGFRYKLALLILPVMLWVYFGNLPKMTKITLSAVIGGCTLALFSVMTLYRVKFGGGLDFSRGGSVDPLYGLFAESNVVFGMASIMGRFVDQDVVRYLEPLVDALKELLPRVFFPDRTSGLYLLDVADGLMTDEGSRSGTAYPFVGEFALMGGYPGIVLGTLAYGLLYCWLHAVVVRVSPSESLMRMGLALLATIMGYYHYSRGYIPQANKAYIFVFAPYLLLCLQARWRLQAVLAGPSRMARTIGRRFAEAPPAGRRPPPGRPAAVAEG